MDRTSSLFSSANSFFFFIFASLRFCCCYLRPIRLPFDLPPPRACFLTLLFVSYSMSFISSVFVCWSNSVIITSYVMAQKWSSDQIEVLVFHPCSQLFPSWSWPCHQLNTQHCQEDISFQVLPNEWVEQIPSCHMHIIQSSVYLHILCTWSKGVDPQSQVAVWCHG